MALFNRKKKAIPAPVPISDEAVKEVVPKNNGLIVGNDPNDIHEVDYDEPKQLPQTIPASNNNPSLTKAQLIAGLVIGVAVIGLAVYV